MPTLFLLDNYKMELGLGLSRHRDKSIGNLILQFWFFDFDHCCLIVLRLNNKILLSLEILGKSLGSILSHHSEKFGR